VQQHGFRHFAEAFLVGEHFIKVAHGAAAHAVFARVHAGGRLAFGGARTGGMTPWFMHADAGGCGGALRRGPAPRRH
jgi:hypothetical protein